MPSSWQINTAASGWIDMTSSHLGLVSVEQFPGAGMAPLGNIATPFGLLDGAVYQRTQVGVRSFTIAGKLKGTSVADLHAKRKLLISLVAPDRSASPGEPLELRYTGGASTLQASVHYAKGLELGQVSARIEQTVGLGFEQFNPYWEKTTSSSATLTVQATFTANFVAQRAACGSWGTLSTGFDTDVNDIISASDGTLYFGGAFTTAGGAAACSVAQWNGTTLSKVGNATSGNAGNSVNKLVIDRYGYLWAGGTILTASNLAAASGLIRWSGTQWQTVASGVQLTTGTGAIVYDLMLDNDGNLLVAGNFNQAGGGAAACGACGIAKLSTTASTWSTVASGMRTTVAAQTATVRGLAKAPNGDIWAVGFFSAAGLTTNTACRVAKYSQTASAWQAVGGSGVSSSTSDEYRSMALTSDGTAYIGGAVPGKLFVTSNGTNISEGASFNDSVESVMVDGEDTVYVSGGFTTVNTLSIQRTTRLIGGTPTKLDVLFPVNSLVYAAHSSSTGVLTLGGTFTGTASAAAVTTVTNNGTAATYPILTACAPVSVTVSMHQLVNYTTGDKVFFNLSLQPLEIVTFDLRPGKKTLTSNLRGNLIGSVLPGSDVATWRLAPGANNVSFFLSGGSGAAKLSWTERFWSIDN